MLLSFSFRFFTFRCRPWMWRWQSECSPGDLDVESFLVICSRRLRIASVAPSAEISRIADSIRSSRETSFRNRVIWKCKQSHNHGSLHLDELIKWRLENRSKRLNMQRQLLQLTMSIAEWCKQSMKMTVLNVNSDWIFTHCLTAQLFKSSIQYSVLTDVERI